MSETRKRCGFRRGAEDWVAMMIGSLGSTNVHIISRVGGSGIEWRLREFSRSSGFMARTGFLADNAHFCRTRSGVHGKGMVFRHFNLTHFLDDHVECLTDINTQTQGSAMRFFSDSNHVRQRSGRPPQSDTAARNRDNLGLGRGRLLGFTLTLSS